MFKITADILNLVPKVGKDGYEPVDMSKFPFRQEDQLPGGIKIKHIQYGTVEDSFAGYVYKPWRTDEATKQKVPIGDAEPTVSEKELDDYTLLLICKLPDPTAQYVHYQDGKGAMHIVRPDVFLALAKSLSKTPDNPLTPTDESLLSDHVETCAAMTRAGKRCLKPAGFGDNQAFCSQHAKPNGE